MSDGIALLGAGMAKNAAQELQRRKSKLDQGIEAAAEGETPQQETRENGIFFKSPVRTPETKARQQKMLVEALRRRDRDFE